MKKYKKDRVIFITVIAGVIGILIGIEVAYLNKNKSLVNGSSSPQVGIGGGPVTQQSLRAEDVVEVWPAESQRVAREIINEYGQPNEITASYLIWNKNTPWKKTIVYREEVQTGFPKMQTNQLEQSINYRVENEKFDKLITDSVSVTVNRAKGELVARSESEAFNFLALNLAHDIIKNNKSVDQAQKEYAEYEQKYRNGERVDYTQMLNFNVPPVEKVREPEESIMQ